MKNDPSQTCPECGRPLPTGASRKVCPACLMAQAIASRTLDGGPPENPLPPPSPEEIAASFPQFEIIECLGRGGMGVVYKARQKSLNRLVAIKILAPERERDSRFAERFAKEAETLAKLSHPHIVTIHDFGETGGLYYLVMEFIDGVNLRDLLREGKLDSQQALAIVPPVCEALQFAHDRGVVHRDIKPENILLDREGRVKIADFGIASLSGDAAEHAGTPAYMAPEQDERNSKVDHRADIYALGVVLYEMLTGERPSGSPVAPSKRVQIDVRLDEIVLRALEHEPARRYQTAGEFNTVIAGVSQPSGIKPATWKWLIAHFSPAILLILAWFTSGLEKGAVLILSVAVVAAMVLRALSPVKAHKRLLYLYLLLPLVGAAIFAFNFQKRKQPPAVAPPPVAKVSVGKVSPGEVNVDGLGKFNSIREALEAAPDNAVIRVGEGIYQERVVIRKPVTLIGVSWEKTRIAVEGPDYSRLPLEKPIAPVLREPAVNIHLETRGKVSLEGISLSMSRPSAEGSLSDLALLKSENCLLTLRHCAFLGSPGSGADLIQGKLTMEDCLIAAAWNTGISIGEYCEADIRNCTVRNCYYAGITMSRRAGEVSISGCRISGAAWHGIRYDDCSPKISNNLIFGNARSGIYLSGDTAGEISGNVLARNEMGSLSCWFESRDLIERNIFADDLREAVMLCGMVSPTIRGNIFVGKGIVQGLASGDRLTAKTYGSPVVERNVFWNAGTPWTRWRLGKDPAQEAVELPEGNAVEDPSFGEGYVLPNDSPLPGRKIGPEKVLSFEGPYPIQPEETAIIPDGETRDSKAWKR
ncbi:MAG: protein kinase [Luteolibacter sp.]|uniref:protein kinase domain-containing protein n=1 Tax=Luteolibacter sp. TaxID=1962973 RepID=UPI00326309FD